MTNLMKSEEEIERGREKGGGGGMVSCWETYGAVSMLTLEKHEWNTEYSYL